METKILILYVLVIAIIIVIIVMFSIYCPKILANADAASMANEGVNDNSLQISQLQATMVANNMSPFTSSST